MVSFFSVVVKGPAADATDAPHHVVKMTMMIIFCPFE
jgi:hypothetical protein